MMLSVLGFLKSIMFLLIGFCSPSFGLPLTQKIKSGGLGSPSDGWHPGAIQAFFTSLFVFPEFSEWPFISLRDPGSTSIYVTDSLCWFISPQKSNPVEIFQDVDL